MKPKTWEKSIRTNKVCFLTEISFERSRYSVYTEYNKLRFVLIVDIFISFYGISLDRIVYKCERILFVVLDINN